MGGFGMKEYYPTLEAKAAYIFFHIATSHIFENGNKRTAVLALDQFLQANSVYLLLDNDEMQKLAVKTASYRERGESKDIAMARLIKAIRTKSIRFSYIREGNESQYRQLLKARRAIREDPRNLRGAMPQQAVLLGVDIRHVPA